MLPSRHLIYEHAVQSPRWQVDYLPQFHRLLTGKKALHFREDFCGSARISCEWVKKSALHTAVGLDLDPEVLEYARTVNLAALSRGQRERVQLLKRDVLRPPMGSFDWVGAFNFSFYAFHERATLLRYVKSVHRSLASSGTVFLEMAGGPGFVEPHSDSKTIQIPGVGRIKQVWEQHAFDPISAVCDYSIHFDLGKKGWMNDAFTYHWRIWTLREVREVLSEAGFERTVVRWEKPDARGEGSGEFEIREDAAPLHSWIAYVVGVKGSPPRSRKAPR
jgi:SAM-dependent methyltransferase